MKIAIHSDLHTEHYQTQVLPVISDDTEYLVLAGDIGNPVSAYRFIRDIVKKYPHLTILYVLGNHEYYGQPFQMVLSRYKASLSEFKNVHVMENDYFVDSKNKAIFYGATLWTDFKLGKNAEESMKWAGNYVNDFYHIFSLSDNVEFGFLDKLKPEEMQSYFKKTVNLIKKTVNQEEYKDYKKIMISHFLPHKDVLNPDYRENLIRSAYWVSHIPEIVSLFDIWIYGHSHHNINAEVNYKGKTTKLISNQKGYPIAETYENSSERVKKDYLKPYQDKFEITV